MKAELFEALEQIEKEKGISKEILLETMEAALITAFKKKLRFVTECTCSYRF